MLQPGRSFEGENYRYGFNGKEKDDEISGIGNAYDYGMRMYNSRLGRPFSVDPLFRQYAMLSPYQFFSNSPIWMTDLDGKEGIVYTIHQFTVNGNTIQDVSTAYDVGGKTEGIMYKLYNIDNSTITTKYIPDIPIVESRTFANIIKDKKTELAHLGNQLDARYYGDKGFKKLGEDVSDGSNVIKLFGYGSLVFGQAEIGLPLIAVGNTMSKTSDVMKVGSKVADGDYEGAVLEFGKVAIKGVLGTTISNSIIKGTGVTDEVIKKSIKTNIDLKIEGTEKLIENETQDSKPYKEE